MKVTLKNGDCLKVLSGMADNSIDAVVTDPPYGISFMGKKWDYQIPSVDVWKECLRVLKPGGHALIACGTRTQHRMAVNIEDAGFEIRDVVTWLYGSGFPKSMDVSKAIDKAAGAEREVVGREVYRKNDSNHAQNGLYHNGLIQDGKMSRSWDITTPATDSAKQWQGWGTALKPATEHMTLARKNGIELTIFNDVSELLCLYLSIVLAAENNSTLSQKGSAEASSIAQWIAESGTNTLGALSGRMDILRSALAKTTFLSTAELWKTILDDVSKNMSTFTTLMASSLTIELKILKCFLLRTIQRSTPQSGTDPGGLLSAAPIVESLLASASVKLSCILSTDAEYDVLRDSGSLTDKLNVNSDFWTLARKPLEKGLTVAQNVQKWGTGAINVDGCRVETNLEAQDMSRGRKSNGKMGYQGNEGVEIHMAPSPLGRWPANLILDEEAAAALDEQSGTLKSGTGNKNKSNKENGKTLGSGLGKGNGDGVGGDSGGASRFFYVAKASKSERNAGLEGMPEKLVEIGDERPSGNSWERRDKRQTATRANHHPTVKPVKLMSYLCRLITPTGGTVLDPFMGSGSTGVGAKKEGFCFIGIELDKEYFEISKVRIKGRSK